MKRYLGALLSAFLCLNSFNVPVLAEGNDTPDNQPEVIEEVLEETPESGEDKSGEPKGDSEKETPEEINNETIDEATPEPSAGTIEEPSEPTTDESVNETVTVVFDKNAEDAEGEMPSQQFSAGKEGSLNPNLFTREGYEFGLWNTEKDASGLFYFDGEKITFDGESSEIILYAQWEKADRISEELSSFENDYQYVEDEEGNLTLTRYIGVSSIVEIPATINDKPVTVIGSQAFAGNSNVYEVTIPEGIKEIAAEAFSQCTNLSDLTIPSTVEIIDPYAFRDCTNLKSAGAIGTGVSIKINFPDYIPDTFRTDTLFKNITYIKIPENVKRLPDYFLRTSIITKAYIPGSITEMGHYVWPKSTNIVQAYPNVNSDGRDYYAIVYGWKGKIPDNAFEGFESIQRITLPSGVTEIGDYAFHDTGIYGGQYPDSIISIGDYAFANCRNITSFRAGSGLKTIGEGAFESCKKLGILELSANLQSIGDNAFKDCVLAQLKSIPSSVEYIGAHAFDSCTSITSVTIPGKVTRVNEGTFANCTGITSISVHDEIELIGSGAFENCKGLTSFSVPGRTNTIESRTFAGCTGMTQITIPLSVKMIRGEAFSRCTALKTVNYLGNKSSWEKIAIEYPNTELNNAEKKYQAPIAQLSFKSGEYKSGQGYTWDGSNLYLENFRQIFVSAPAISLPANSLVILKGYNVISMDSGSVGSVIYGTGTLRFQADNPGASLTINGEGLNNGISAGSLYIGSESGDHFPASIDINASDSGIIVRNTNGVFFAGENWTCTINSARGIEASKGNVSADPASPASLTITATGTGINCKTLEIDNSRYEINAGSSDSPAICVQNISTESGSRSGYFHALSPGMVCKTTSTGGEIFSLAQNTLTVITPEQYSWNSSALSDNTTGNAAEELLIQTCLLRVFGGSGTTISGDAGTVVPIHAYEKPGYTFSRWSASDGDGNAKESDISYLFGEGSSETDEDAFITLDEDSHYITAVYSPILVSELTLNKTDLVLAKGSSETLLVSLLPEDAADQKLIWSSDKADCVSVESDGTVTALKAGKAVITVSSNDGGATASCNVTVIIPIQRIVLSQKELIMEKGTTKKLSAFTVPSDTTEPNIIWNSDNEKIASIDEKGTITANEAGSAVIRATSSNGNVFAECNVSVVISPTDIQLIESEITINKNENYQIQASVLPLDTTDQTLTYTSNDELIASVNDSGIITAKKSGKTQITISTAGGKIKKNLTVNVYSPLTGIKFSYREKDLDIGTLLSLPLNFEPADASNKRITLESSDETVVSVKDGCITALKKGKAVVTATSEEGQFTDSMTVEVKVPVKSVTITPKSSTMTAVGETIQLAAEVKPDNANDTAITWYSSDKKVAVVDENGLVTAVSSGSAGIYARSSNYCVGICDITVKVPVTSLILEQERIHLFEIGDTVSLNAKIMPEQAANKRIIWESSDKGIVTVDQNGVVTAKGSGTAIITATTEDGGFTRQCVADVMSFTINKNNLVMAKGDYEAIQVSIVPADIVSNKLVWESSDETVVQVDQNGIVYAVGNGNAVITGTIESGQKVTCYILVQSVAETIEASKRNLDLVAGESKKLTAMVFPTSAVNSSVLWTSSNTAVATVDQTGNVKAVSAGTAVIQAKTIDGRIEDSCLVNVLAEEPLSINDAEKVKLKNVILKYGQKLENSYWMKTSWDANGKRIYTDGESEYAEIEYKPSTDEFKFSHGLFGDGKLNMSSFAFSMKKGDKRVFIENSVSFQRTNPTFERVSLKGEYSGLKSSVTNDTNFTITYSFTSASMSGFTEDHKQRMLNDELYASAVRYSQALSDFGISMYRLGFTKLQNLEDDGRYSSIPVLGITLGTETKKMKINESFRIIAAINPIDATNQKVTWTSQDPNVAEVDQNGNVTAKGKGTVYIVATTKDGSKTAQCKITVEPSDTVVTNITLSQTELTLGKDRSERLSTVISPEDAAGKTIIWTSSNYGTAKVDQNGVVTGISSGEATITATSEDGRISASCNVKVVIAVDKVSLNRTELRLKKGESFILNATVSPLNANNRKVVWVSNNQEVATVDGSGKVIARGNGTADITVSTEDGTRSAICKVTVYVPVTGIKLDQEEITIGTQRSMMLVSTVDPSDSTNKNVKWKSLNSGIATVDQSGTVTGIRKGKTTIVAETEDNNYSAECTVNVYTAVNKVSLNYSELNLVQGRTEKLTATITPSNADNKKIAWSSSNSNVVTVDDQGNITAVGVGTATIYAVAEDGDLKSECIVTSVILGEGIVLNQTELTIFRGRSETLKAEVLPKETTNKKVVWSSNNTSVALVDQNGKVTAVSAGSAVITVTSEDGRLTAKCNVTVQVPVTGVSLLKKETIIPKGKTESLQAVIQPSDATNKKLIWTSNDETIATVNQSGTVTGVKGGITAITVTTEDGSFSATCNITVDVSVSNIVLNHTSMKIARGESDTLTAEVEPDDVLNKNVIWSSSDNEVVTVDQNGKITGQKTGNAIITAKSETNGVSAECAVTVIVPLRKIVFAEPSVTIPAGHTKSVSITLEPKDTTETDVIFSSEDPSVAVVDNAGKITAIKQGNTIITASSKDGSVTGSCEVTVVQNEIYVKGLLDHYTYNGSAIKPAVQVYDSGTLLAEKTDYTLSYKSNTNAGTAVLTVTGKGSYASKKEVTFTIDPINMDEVFAEEISLVQTAKPKTLKVSPKVTWNGKTLKSGKDYDINYNGWNQQATGKHEIILNGKGNFTGEKKVDVFVSSPDQVSVSKLKVTSKAVSYTAGLDFEKDILPNVTVADGKNPLIKDTHYTVSDARDCDRAGTCTFVITGIGDVYYGQRTVSVKINGTAISSASTTGSAVYDGIHSRTLENSAGITVVLKGTQLRRGVDYEVVPGTYENNINAGKASVTIQGIGQYSGTKKLTYTIAPDTSRKIVEVLNSVEYSKGGAIPEVTVKREDGIVLKEGSDYKLTWKNNKKVGTASVSVSFLGNYKGSSMNRPNPITFIVTAKDLNEVSVSAPDVLSKKNNKGNFKSKIELYDQDGKKLASSDYTIVSYKCGDTELDKNYVVNIGDVITARIEGKGSYAGSAREVSYKVVSAGLDLSKATIKVRDQEYTGYEIEIDPAKDITTATIKDGALKYGENYKILCYENNVKKGTAKVTFIGFGNCYGTKTVSFKITQRSVSNHWFDAIREALGFEF